MAAALTVFALRPALAPAQTAPILYASDDTERIPTFPPTGTMVPDSNHVFSIADTTLEIHGARGEWLGCQLAVVPVTPLTNLDVTATDLRFAGHAIPGDSITVYRSGFMTIDYQARCPGLVPVRGATGDGTYRDFLIPMRDPYGAGGAVGAGIGADSTVVYWADVHIPPRIPSGAYRGDFLITADEIAGPIRIHLVVDVWDFTISNDTDLITLVGINPSKIETAEEVSLEDNGLNADFFNVFNHYETMARDHGFDLLHKQMVPDYNFAADGHLTSVNWGPYDEFLGPIIRGERFADGQRPKAWMLPVRPAFLAYPFAAGADSLVEIHKVEDVTAEIQAHFQSTYPGFPLDRAFIWVYDEPDAFGLTTGYLSDGEVREIRRYNEAVKAGSNLNVFISEAPEDGLLLGAVDWLATKADKYYWPEMDGIRDTSGVAMTLFYQANTEPDLGVETIDTDAAAFRTWGWAAWKYHVGGMMYWAGNYWSTDPYVVPDGLEEGTAVCPRANGQGTLFYPGRALDDIGLPAIDGPLSSMRMKRLRRGIEDYAYFERLRDHGREALADSVVDAVLVSALCDSAPGGEPNYSPTKSYTYAGRPSHYTGPGTDKRGDSALWSKDARTWYQARLTLGDQLAAMGEDTLMTWVLEPNGGEILVAGRANTIRWQSSGAGAGAQVDLFLSNDGGATIADTIATGQAGDGELVWDGTTSAGDTLWCMAHLRDGGDTAEDVSDGFFTVYTPPESLELYIGFSQNPVLTEYLDVFVIPSEAIQDTSLRVMVGEDEILMERTDPDHEIYHGPYQLPLSGLLEFEACARDLEGNRRCFTRTATVTLVRGETGGLAASADGILLLRFLPGTFPRDTHVMISRSGPDGAARSGGVMEGPPYRVGPVGRSLQEPAEVRFAVPEGGSDGAAREQLGVAFEDGETWRPLPSFIDARTGDIFALADVLGNFRLVRSEGETLSETLPPALTMDGNRPNPFNPSTTISYRLPRRAQVRVEIYDVGGRRLRTLVNGVQGPGHQETTWDGSDDFGRPAASGIYLCRIHAGDETRSSKMVMLK